jgi:hypothetical protein
MNNRNSFENRVKGSYVLVTEYDQEDWSQLFRNEYTEVCEDGKSFLRVY